MVFIYSPVRLITPVLVPLMALTHILEIVWPNTVGGGGAGHFSTHNLCILCTFLCKSVQDIVATRIIEILHINSIFKNRTMLFMFITNMTSGM